VPTRFKYRDNLVEIYFSSHLPNTLSSAISTRNAYNAPHHYLTINHTEPKMAAGGNAAQLTLGADGKPPMEFLSTWVPVPWALSPRTLQSCPLPFTVTLARIGEDERGRTMSRNGSSQRSKSAPDRNKRTERRNERPRANSGTLERLQCLQNIILTVVI